MNMSWNSGNTDAEKALCVHASNSTVSTVSIRKGGVKEYFLTVRAAPGGTLEAPADFYGRVATLVADLDAEIKETKERIADALETFQACLKIMKGTS